MWDEAAKQNRLGIAQNKSSERLVGGLLNLALRMINGKLFYLSLLLKLEAVDALMQGSSLSTSHSCLIQTVLLSGSANLQSPLSSPLMT